MLNYPLKFEPILKQKIWGGEKLKNILDKNSDEKDIGESWEISNVEHDVSIVANGELKGKSLRDLMQMYQADLLGKKVYAIFKDQFPLLIKYIDAKEALSIQLHPHDDLAKKRHNSFGKTEMWYVMQADKAANLIVGFKKEVTKEEYIHHLENKTLTEILNIDTVDKGDVYFIPTGRVHAIGAGVLLAEIQQTSDITYRIYDWDRQDDDGNYRDLHTELALDAMEYRAKKEYKTSYKSKLNQSENIVSCQYFTTNVIELDGQIQVDHKDKDSFIIYMCVEGEASIVCNNGKTEQIKMGETILIPAVVKEIAIKSNIKSRLLEVSIP